MIQEEIQRLRDLPIEGVAGRLGLKVKHHKSLCPFHTTDKHPSLSFHTGKNICRCFVCMNEAMGPISLVMRYLKLGFKDACRWLADENCIPITIPESEGTESSKKAEAKPFDPSRYLRFFEHPYLSPEAKKFLFEERRLDPRVVNWCRLTSWTDRNGVNWLQIPYYDEEGRLIGVQNRRGPSPVPFLTGRGVDRGCNYNNGPNTGQGESIQSPSKGDLKGPGPLPRFRFPPGSHCSIYNLPMLRYLKPGDECWIAEGCSDAWSHMSDRHKVIAIASATLLQPKDKELLQAVTARLEIRWKMAPDQDEPGRRLAAQLKEILPMLQIVELEAGCKDYSDFYLRRKSNRLTDN